MKKAILFALAAVTLSVGAFSAKAFADKSQDANSCCVKNAACCPASACCK